MAMPNWCQQAGPQPCVSIDDIPRPILRDHLCEWHGVMHQNKQLGIQPYRNIGAYVKWTRLCHTISICLHEKLLMQLEDDVAIVQR